MIASIFMLLPLVGAAAIIVLAQTQVKERSERAAMALTAGGALEAGYALLVRFWTQQDVLWLLSPLVHVGALAAVCWGLLALVDDANPKRPTPLPPSLSSHQDPVGNVPSHVMLGVFGVLGMLGTSGMSSLPMKASAVLAIVGTLAGSIWVTRQGSLPRWVLERRPDLVTWSYVYQLRVVNRQTGSSTTHWSAQLGLATGAKVALAAISEQGAQALVLAVMQVCPNAVAGFSAENAARFKASPAAMRG